MPNVKALGKVGGKMRWLRQTELHVTSHCDQPFYMEAQRAPTSALLGLPALVISCSSGSDLVSIAATVAKFVQDLQYWWQNCM
jgi:hypothetical protein